MTTPVGVTNQTTTISRSSLRRHRIAVRVPDIVREFGDAAARVGGAGRGPARPRSGRTEPVPDDPDIRARYPRAVEDVGPAGEQVVLHEDVGVAGLGVHDDRAGAAGRGRDDRVV